MHARNRRVVKRVTVRSMIRGPPRETNTSSQWEAAELTFKNDYRWVMNTAWRWPLPSLSSVCDRRLYMQVLQQLPVQPQVWAGLTAGRPHTAASPHCDGSAVTPHTTASQHGGAQQQDARTRGWPCCCPPGAQRVPLLSLLCRAHLASTHAASQHQLVRGPFLAAGSALQC